MSNFLFKEWHGYVKRYRHISYIFYTYSADERELGGGGMRGWVAIGKERENFHKMSHADIHGSRHYCIP